MLEFKKLEVLLFFNVDLGLNIVKTLLIESQSMSGIGSSVPPSELEVVLAKCGVGLFERRKEAGRPAVAIDLVVLVRESFALNPKESGSKESMELRIPHATVFDFVPLLPCIIAAVESIKQLTLPRVWLEFDFRIDLCHVNQGAHMKLM